MDLNPPAEFDPVDELSRFGDPDHELYGLEQRVFFYLVATCRGIGAFAAPAFTIDSVFGPPGLTPAGCWIEFVVHRHAFWIDTAPGRVKLWTASADDADGARNRYLVHDGVADNPAAWECLLKTVARVEKFGILIHHAAELRRLWTEWLGEQGRREDERGW